MWDGPVSVEREPYKGSYWVYWEQIELLSSKKEIQQLRAAAEAIPEGLEMALTAGPDHEFHREAADAVAIDSIHARRQGDKKHTNLFKTSTDLPLKPPEFELATSAEDFDAADDDGASGATYPSRYRHRSEHERASRAAHQKPF